MDSKYALPSKSKFALKGSNGFSVKRKLNHVHGVAKIQKLSSTEAASSTEHPKKSKPNVQIFGSKTGKSDTISSNKSALAKVQTALPAFKCRQHLLQEIKKSETVLLMGETGSGKTTQIPQLLLTAGYGNKGVIGVTQPRRVAAITIAKRVAQEQGCRLGDEVGYTVRFEDCNSPKTRIRFLTDGSLLREALADRMLSHYSVLMLDEAHERTVNTDVLFGIVKEAQNKRKKRGSTPLKVIVTSATMDIDHFSRYFGVPGLYLEGRVHDVKLMHAKTTQSDYVHSALVTLFNFHRSTPADHDVLIFLTGQEEIETMAQQIRQIAKVMCNELPGVRVYPLYAQLPQNKQLECFLPAPSNARKIVLATNVAETSITIPGIRCVIDCGFVKQRIYNQNSGLDVLRVVRISHAQAWQRCGRAGRDASGTCFRTYTQAEMATFEHMSKPEILRSNISSTVLQLLAMRIECRNFDFLDRPSPDAIENAYRRLESLGAIRTAKNPELTSLGRQMAQFPLHPMYSKMLLSSSQFGCMEEMLSIVAVLSGETLFITNTEKRELASLAHAKFQSKYGDHLTLLNVFNGFLKADRTKIWCHDNFLNTRNLLYAREVRKQLTEIVQRLGMEINSCGGDHDKVRKCLLAGLFENLGELQRDNTYLTIPGKQRAKLHPSSVFHGKYKPDYIIFTEIVLTERNYLRVVTEIRPEWIVEVLPNYKYLNKVKFSHK